MSDVFIREGELTDIASYPAWAQDMVESCAEARRKVAQHELFHRMRDAAVDESQISTFLVGVWSVIEQFPQYMAQNMLKVQFGRSRGHDEARRYLIRNIRVEQNHADHWLNWAVASGASREDLLHGEVSPETHALSHWCWHTCERDSLAAGMAATRTKSPNSQDTPSSPKRPWRSPRTRLYRNGKEARPPRQPCGRQVWGGYGLPCASRSLPFRTSRLP